jgi:pSer/pThr/pTyr-binding forkhead associated (FHA) protein
VPLAQVGRGSHNDIVIQDDSVSETHAKLQRRDEGWYVVDVGSTNGTYVGGQRLVAERRLDGAPDVRFGGVKTIFHATDAPVDVVAGTRAIASVDRSKLRPPAQGPRTVSPGPAATPAAEPAQAIATWVWIVVALAVLGAVVLFARSR